MPDHEESAQTRLSPCLALPPQLLDSLSFSSRGRMGGKSSAPCTQVSGRPREWSRCCLASRSRTWALRAVPALPHASETQGQAAGRWAPGTRPRALPRGRHLSGPDLQRRARCRRHSVTLRGLATPKGRGVPRGEPGSSWSVRTEDRRYCGESAPSGSLPGLTDVSTLPSPVLCLPFTLCPVGRALRTDPGQDGLCVGPRRMSPTCRQLPSGSAPGRVLLSFLRRAPQTAGEVKGSWASAHSQGRSRGLDSFLPVRASPGGLLLRSRPRLHLVACSLCPSGKPGIR
ncbi:uncharacterized protein LOC133763745 [Lepus europaeus]|uniref:uncharacterized protein LOC133763745 n=1 Tax=Lepus europaeus TaxID=9983 RepID=UPI002B46E936|nr:uncharacterized protein LOC133763745 [Lepus europaeus]